MQLKGARCLVTGASRGIGRELVTALSQAGGRVWAGVRDESALADLRGTGVSPVVLDVTDPKSVGTALNVVGDVDVLVNNAGLLVSGAVEEIGDSDLLEQYETNVFGPWRLCRLVLPGMRDRGGGAIVNLCSIGGELAYPGLGAYRSSKFALRCLSWTLHLEVARFGIRVLNAEPGAVATDFSTRSKRIGAGVDDDSPYSRMRSSADAAYARIAPARILPSEVAAEVVRELEADSGPLDVLIGPDAKRLAELRDAGPEAYERELRLSFGLDWLVKSGAAWS